MKRFESSRTFFWQVVVRKVVHVFGTFVEDVVKCLEKCLESVCNFRELVERFTETFLWKFGKVVGNDVRTFLKVWIFVGNMFWKRVGKSG